MPLEKRLVVLKCMQRRGRVAPVEDTKGYGIATYILPV
jgi:hypothetical protein